jgi:hypothetical protein
VATIADMQMTKLQALYAGSEIQSLPDGTQLVTVPAVKLPPGWNQEETAVRFIIPNGYPAGQPDCFWADSTLRLANGNVPANANPQPLPHLGTPQLWFSWHVDGWNAARNNLVTYMRVIEARFRSAQ